MWRSGIRLLLDTHIKDCKDDRERTGSQFLEVSRKLDKLETKIETNAVEREKQHSENQTKLDKLSKLIYMAVGAISLLGFLFSDTGHGLLHLLSSTPR
jgi:hypothetical protein